LQVTCAWGTAEARQEQLPGWDGSIPLRGRQPTTIEPRNQDLVSIISRYFPFGVGTKHARIIAMLRAPAGATLATIMTATEWQPHSVRGFLAGIVRKKLGLNLVSEQTDKGRIYRIKDGKASSATAARASLAQSPEVVAGSTRLCRAP
jgi:hypothetical protein